MNEILFESIYNKSHIYKLVESRKINSADDIFSDNGIRFLAGLLGGKKNIPSFFLDENHKEYLTAVINKVLNSSIFKNDINFASDQAIAFIIKVSKTPADVQDLLKNHFDTVIEYGICCNSDWFKKSDFVKQILDAPEYSSDNMHKLEKYLQEEHSKRSKSKSIKISNAGSLYDVLYDDGTWKLCVPKNFEGNVELSSHIEFIDEQDEISHKTKWCTAANKTYYDMYTYNGNLPLYVIQYYENGKYTKAWQVAFCHRDYDDEPKGHIEIMNESDLRDWKFLFNCPKELVSKITDSGIVLDKYEYSLNLLDLLNDINLNVSYNYEDGDLLDLKYQDFLDWEEVQEIVPGYKKGQVLQITDLGKLKELSDYKDVKVKYIVPLEQTVLDDETFQCYSCLSEIVIHDKVTKIGNDTFSNCINLESIKIPDSVTDIGDSAFYNNTSLKQVILPKNLTVLSNDLFNYCQSLTNIEIPSGVKTIMPKAFYACDSLTEITIPDSVEIIEDFAVYMCRGLKKVVIGKGIRNLQRCTFYGCDNIEKVYIPKGCIYDEDIFPKNAVIIEY
jgi:hypothetical protein